MQNYFAVRNAVGLYDASHAFGRLFARGKDAIDLLHRMSTNEMKFLETEKSRAVLTVLTNEKARIVDVLNVIRDEAGDVMLVTSAGKELAVIQWLDKFTIMEDARFVTASEDIAQFLLCGSKAHEILTRLCTGELQLDRNSVLGGTIADVPVTIVKAPSLAGSGWFVFALKERAEEVWNVLSHDVTAADGAIMDGDLFDLLRIENGTPIAPNELNDKHNPLETTLAEQAVSFTKGCYIGQEVIARLDAQDKVQRTMMGLKFEGALPVVGDRLTIEGLDSPLGNEVGEVTSVATSPKHGRIGLGYVRGKYAISGEAVSIAGERATLVELPMI